MRIFLLEDDVSLQKGISLKLTKEGHEIKCASCVKEGLLCASERFDMAILDVNLPDGSGLDLCAALRESAPETHILILTANDMETDIVMGYELGADDYMTKPFSLAVLLSKVGAVSRKLLPRGEDSGASSCETVSTDPARMTATVRGKTVALTRNEMRLLSGLLKNAGQVLTKERLLETLWDIDGDFVDENTLAVNIRRLREKLEVDPGNPRLIENIRGVGYRLNGDVK